MARFFSTELTRPKRESSNTIHYTTDLFKDKHGVVEELLKFLIGEVDTKLFKGVELNKTIHILVHYYAIKHSNNTFCIIL